MNFVSNSTITILDLAISDYETIGYKNHFILQLLETSKTYIFLFLVKQQIFFYYIYIHHNARQNYSTTFIMCSGPVHKFFLKFMYFSGTDMSVNFINIRLH